jgi:hypothetical protein
VAEIMHDRLRDLKKGTKRKNKVAINNRGNIRARSQICCKKIKENGLLSPSLIQEQKGVL